MYFGQMPSKFQIPNFFEMVFVLLQHIIGKIRKSDLVVSRFVVSHYRCLVRCAIQILPTLNKRIDKYPIALPER